MSDLGKLMAPLARRLGNMLARGSVAAANGAGKMRTLQIRMMAGETKDNVEHFEPYGFTSEPLPGAEHISAFFDGDRSHGITLVVADRRFRLRGLDAGEVAIFDDQGQRVHLTRTGIVVKGAGLPVLVTDTPTVTIEASTSVVLDTPLVDIKHRLMVRELMTGQGGLALQGAGSGAAATITGTVQVNAGDVKADDISLKTHRQTGVQPGVGNSGGPTP